MPEAADVTDSSDWKETRLSELGAVDAALRCQVCKEFFVTAMITSCSHTFCSICIRRTLAQEGKCPTCRTSEQEVKLRRNWAVQEVVDAFQAARYTLLELAKQPVVSNEVPDSSQVRRGSKRKRGEVDSMDGEDSRRQTRASSRRSVHSRTDASGDDFMPSSQGSGHQSEGDFEARPSRKPQPKVTSPPAGMVSCPMCAKHMKEEVVFDHLDHCKGENAGSAPAHPPPQQRPPPTKPKPAKKVPPPERLPHLNYSLLKENPLRKKISELGIPSWGSRGLLMRRHTEWTNLWNANCDAAQPLSKQQLLRQLDAWERTQGGHTANEGAWVTNPFKEKDFDGQAWGKQNKSDFDSLIARARAGRNASRDRKPTDTELGSLERGRGPETESKPEPATEVALAIAPAPAPALPSHEPKGVDRLHDSPAALISPSTQTPPSTSAARRPSISWAESKGASPPTRRKPMFELPQDPITDAEMIN